MDQSGDYLGLLRYEPSIGAEFDGDRKKSPLNTFAFDQDCLAL